MENSSFIINIKSLEKSYGYGRSSVKVLKGIDLEVASGEVISITGPSGTGKSTLLNLIGCLDNFDNGVLKISGMDVSSFEVDALSDFRNRHIGFIFQLHNLLLEFSAIENIMMPLLIRRMSVKEAREKSMELLKRFNLENRAHHKA